MVSRIILVIGLASLLTISALALRQVSGVTTHHSPLTNTAGVTYPATRNSTVISEQLAHTDVYLGRSVFGQDLLLTVRFTPLETESLAVGVRENSFWLSYTPQIFYQAGEVQNKDVPTTRTIRLPLTDKIQEPDQSIDVMFFANTAGQATAPDRRGHDTTTWSVHELSTTLESHVPSGSAIRDYVRSFLTRERAL